ncbi:MAG TPA: hypothetical protein DCG19_11235 [Cryomorphaceae bacterium]|nr:hypothetical protein [Cryomorphaceae bacterium]
MTTIEDQLAFINQYSQYLEPTDLDDISRQVLSGVIWENLGFKTSIGLDHIHFDSLGLKLPLAYDLRKVHDKLKYTLGQYGLSREDAQLYCWLQYFLGGIHHQQGDYTSSGWKLGHAVFVLQYCLTGRFDDLGTNCHPWLEAGGYDSNEIHYGINYHGIELRVKKNYKVDIRFESDQQLERFKELLSIRTKVEKMKSHRTS